MSLSNPALESADVVSLGDEQRAIEILAQSVLGLWEVVNNLTRLRATKREEFRVTIFGSARIPPVVVVRGGIGTVLELAMVWQLLQVRKLYSTPLILIGQMWAELVEWARSYLLRPEFEMASPADLDIPHCVTNANEAIALIRRHHEEWIARSAGTRRDAGS